MDWVVIGVILGVVVLDSLIHVLAVRLTLPYFEHKLPLNAELFPPDPEAETVCFPTSDGLNLHGCLYLPFESPPRGIVLFCPEFGSDRWSAMSYASALWEAGFAIFAFDFRNQGESDHMPGYDPLHWVTEYEVQDALSAIRYISSRPDLRDLPLGLLGISRGGGAALAAGAASPRALCVAADGAFSVNGMILHYTRRWAQLHLPIWFLKLIPIWHVWCSAQIMRWLSQFTRNCVYTPLERVLVELRGKPVLLMSGERDSYVSPEITIDLHRRLGQPPNSLWIIPFAKHNRGRQASPEEYDQRLIEFFGQIVSPRYGAAEPFGQPHETKDSIR